MKLMPRSMARVDDALAELLVDLLQPQVPAAQPDAGNLFTGRAKLAVGHLGTTGRIGHVSFLLTRRNLDWRACKHCRPSLAEVTLSTALAEYPNTELIGFVR